MRCLTRICKPTRINTALVTARFGEQTYTQDFFLSTAVLIVSRVDVLKLKEGNAYQEGLFYHISYYE